MNLSQPKVSSSSEEILKTSPPFTTHHHHTTFPTVVPNFNHLVLPSTVTGPHGIPAAHPSCSPSTSNVTTASQHHGLSPLTVNSLTGMASADAAVVERVPWNPFTSNCIPGRSPVEDKKALPQPGYVSSSNSVIGRQHPQTPPTSSAQPISVIEDEGLSVSVSPHAPLSHPPGAVVPAAPVSHSPLLMVSSAPSLTLPPSIGIIPSPSVPTGGTVPAVPSPSYPPSVPLLPFVGESFVAKTTSSSTSSAGSFSSDVGKDDPPRCEQQQQQQTPTAAAGGNIKILIMNDDLPEEDKIDVCSVKETFLLKQVEGGVDRIVKDNFNKINNGDAVEVIKKDSGSPVFSQLGPQCSRTVPSLMKFYSRHKRSLSTSLSVNLAVSGQATPPCSPISPGTMTVLPVPPLRSSIEASTMTSPTDRSRATPSETSQISLAQEQQRAISTSVVTTASGVGSSPIAALTLLTMPELDSQPLSGAKLSSPTSLKAAKKSLKPDEKETGKIVSLENSPAVTSVGSIPPGITFPAPWPLPHNTIAHPGSYWIHPSQFSGVDAGTGLGLGYHVARDPLTGHLFLLPRPHPISDPSGHGIVWAGYGSVPTPPVVMTPQQLLLDPRYRPTLHAPPPIMHVHPATPAIHSQQSQTQVQQQAIKKEDSSPTPQKEENKKTPVSLVDVPPNQSADMTLPHIPPPNISPHFLYPPTSLPYYYTQPTHPSPFSLPAFPPHPANTTLGLPTGLTTNLLTSLTTNPFTSSTTTVTTCTSSIPATPPLSINSSKGSCPPPFSVWSRGATHPIPSPGPHRDLLYGPSPDNQLSYSEPPMDLTRRSPKIPSPPGEALIPPCLTPKGHSPVRKSSSQSEETALSTSPLRIKKEIKEEVIFPCFSFAHGCKELTVTHLPSQIKAECTQPSSGLREREGSPERLLHSCETTETEVNNADAQRVDSTAADERTAVLRESLLPNGVTQEEEPCLESDPPPPPAASAANAIDSSGLELLLQTFLEHGDRLALSPPPRESDLDSISSQSEQMPLLERAAKTPSPRCSPASFESQPPVLTPFTFPNDGESPPLSPEPTTTVSLTPPPPDLYLEPTTPFYQPPKPPSRLSVLCALVEQRILEEQQNSCSALSSLAEVASSTPSVPMDTPLQEQLSSEEFDDDDIPPPPPPAEQPSNCFVAFPSASSIEYPSHDQLKTDKNADMSLRSPDINRNYKSPESERDARAFIANKASQYQKDSSVEPEALPSYPVDDMDPTEVGMRMKLADIQRQYKEKQRELSRLQPKKDATALKRGRGRPPKRKVHPSYTGGVKRKVGRPLKKMKLDVSSSPPEAKSLETKPLEDHATGGVLPLKEHEKSASENGVSEETRCFENTSLANRWQLKVEEESSDEDDSILESSNLTVRDSCCSSTFKPPSVTQETKQEESDEDHVSNGISSTEYSSSKHSQQTETSVESSTSDAEFHSTSSSSKKRKPGRPKKHSPTKYDATETIVAKKPKTLGFLLLSQKTKIRPKLKAELKVRSDKEDNHNGIQGQGPEQHLSDEDSEDHHGKGGQMLSRKSKKLAGGEGLQRRGAPMGRTSLSRNTVLRDKEKRKSVFEKNSRMQELFRSLKRYSTIAAAEHDESEDEKEYKVEESEPQLRKTVEEKKEACEDTKPVLRNLLTTASDSPSQPPDDQSTPPQLQGIEESQVKTEPKTYFSSAGSPSGSPMESTTESLEPTAAGPGEDVAIKEETSDQQQSAVTTNSVCEKEKESSICSLQVEDLVRGARVMILQDGLLYAGSLSPITPPDVYGVHVDGERGTRPHICCQEELLTQAWKEVKPGSTRFLTEGTRVCAFWSQQYRGLYPGCVAAASSPTHEGNHNLVNVEFDDGDSGRIHVDDIRLLPQDFPVVEYDPNPLLSLNKRRRRPTEEEDTKPTHQQQQLTTKAKNTRRRHRCPSREQSLEKKEGGGCKEAKATKKEPTKRRKKKVGTRRESPVSDLKKRHKKRRKHCEVSVHKHKHKRKHKHKHKDSGGQVFPHVEQGDSELRMRIKSPPPRKGESASPSESSSDEEESRLSETESSEQPMRRQKRSPSEKSKIAPFLLERQLWRWAGKGYKRPGSKGKGRKEFHKEIVRGKEHIRVSDCAVFLSSGSPERPFIGRIDSLWEAWGGNMVVKVRWFYHPDETVGTERKLAEPRGALFSSSHTDENDVQTISHKCHVVPLAEYRVRRMEADRKKGSDYENYDLYYLAGNYDPTYTRITMEPGVS